MLRTPRIGADLQTAQTLIARLSPVPGDLRHRIAIAREPNPDGASGPPMRRLLGELAYVVEPVRRLFEAVEVAPARHPHTVMLLPGFGAHPLRMRHLARHLERAGHRAKRWGLGFNLGATPETFDSLERRLVHLAECDGEPVTLVGWSLGGIFARELAKHRPDAVARVITLGTPFSGSPRANNAWRAYQFVTGHRVSEPPVEAEIAVKPPVPTVALWSPRDGIVSPRSARGLPGERDRTVALRCTHMGFVHAAEAIAAILREVDAA
jgi:pimeloyl-ACP methyl ester carboxylesterase